MSDSPPILDGQAGASMKPDPVRDVLAEFRKSRGVDEEVPVAREFDSEGPHTRGNFDAKISAIRHWARKFQDDPGFPLVERATEADDIPAAFSTKIEWLTENTSGKKFAEFNFTEIFHAPTPKGVLTLIERAIKAPAGRLELNLEGAHPRGIMGGIAEFFGDDWTLLKDDVVELRILRDLEQLGTEEWLAELSLLVIAGATRQASYVAPFVYTQGEADFIAEHGFVSQKKPSNVYLLKQDRNYVVHTNEGPLEGLAGGYVAYDPKSGHVWPVSAEYVEMHYYGPGELPES